MPQRLVGYGEGTALSTALSKGVGEVVNSDYFHPVLSEMRHPLFCAAWLTPWAAASRPKPARGAACW